MLAVGVLEVVGERDGLGPHAAATVGDADNPAAGALAAAIAERDAGADGGEVLRFLLHRQLQAGGAVFQGSIAGAAGHGVQQVSGEWA